MASQRSIEIEQENIELKAQVKRLQQERDTWLKLDQQVTAADEADASEVLETLRGRVAGTIRKPSRYTRLLPYRYGRTTPRPQSLTVDKVPIIAFINFASLLTQMESKKLTKVPSALESAVAVFAAHPIPKFWYHLYEQEKEVDKTHLAKYFEG